MFESRQREKSPLFLSGIWSSSYLSLVEEIPRCPHRPTGQLWYGELFSPADEWDSVRTHPPLFSQWKRAFNLWQTKQPFRTWVCRLFRELPIHCLCVIEAITISWKDVFHVLELPEGILMFSKRTQQQNHFSVISDWSPLQKQFFITSSRFPIFVFALNGWTHWVLIRNKSWGIISDLFQTSYASFHVPYFNPWRMISLSDTTCPRTCSGGVCCCSLLVLPDWLLWYFTGWLLCLHSDSLKKFFWQSKKVFFFFFVKWD